MPWKFANTQPPHPEESRSVQSFAAQHYPAAFSSPVIPVTATDPAIECVKTVISLHLRGFKQLPPNKGESR
jgi:hypothetical protein